MRKITITATHGRGGWTRYAGKTLDVAEEGPSTETAMSGFDAECCVGEGLGAWAPQEAARDVPLSPPPDAEAAPPRPGKK